MFDLTGQMSRGCGDRTSVACRQVYALCPTSEVGQFYYCFLFPGNIFAFPSGLVRLDHQEGRLRVVEDLLFLLHFVQPLRKFAVSRDIDRIKFSRLFVLVKRGFGIPEDIYYGSTFADWLIPASSMPLPMIS